MSCKCSLCKEGWEMNAIHELLPDMAAPQQPTPYETGYNDGLISFPPMLEDDEEYMMGYEDGKGDAELDLDPPELDQIMDQITSIQSQLKEIEKNFRLR